MKINVDARVRLGLHAYMYEIAKENAVAAEALSGKDERGEAKASMVSIIFAHTCLETYINTVGIDNLSEDWGRFKGKKNSTVDKWLGISGELAKRKFGRTISIYNNRKQPFKDFLELDKTRDILIHLKPDFEVPAKTKYGNTDPMLNTLNSQRAKWACKIVPAMVEKLDGLLIRPYPDWV